MDAQNLRVICYSFTAVLKLIDSTNVGSTDVL